MKKINKLYKELPDEEEIFFQIKNKKMYDKILDELQKQLNDSWLWIDWFKEYPVNNTYFILGNWRGGMFGIRNSKTDIEVHICANYKEPPLDLKKHLEQIEIAIKVFDNYRRYIRISRVCFDEHYNIVRN